MINGRIWRKQMPYDVECRNCREHTWAGNIVALLSEYTDSVGRFVCSHCESTDTYIYRESALQEEGEVWTRWIKGVIQIDSGIPTYSPYVFLTANEEDGKPSGLHFHYYKDTRRQPNGRLKHGHGPGGPPVLDNADLFVILRRLVEIGVVSRNDVKSFADEL
jgi:hypothetical protein